MPQVFKIGSYTVIQSVNPFSLETGSRTYTDSRVVNNGYPVTHSIKLPEKLGCRFFLEILKSEIYHAILIQRFT